VDERRVESSAKTQATYWLGLLSYDDGNYAVAADFFAHPELNKKESPSRAGAQYNLARSLEAQQKLDEAVPLLESSESPQQHGDKLRARELKSRTEAEKTAQPGE
jgi:TolA-binding protein